MPSADTYDSDYSESQNDSYSDLEYNSSPSKKKKKKKKHKKKKHKKHYDDEYDDDDYDREDRSYRDEDRRSFNGSGGSLGYDDDDDYNSRKSGRSSRRASGNTSTAESWNDERSTVSSMTQKEMLKAARRREKQDKKAERQYQKEEKRAERQYQKEERKLERQYSKAERKHERQMKKQQKLYEKEQAQIKEQRRKHYAELTQDTGPRWTPLFRTVAILTAGELGLDLGQTIISFITLFESFECCGETVEKSTLTLSITLPYIGLILIELLVLLNACLQARRNSRIDQMRLDKMDELNLDEWYYEWDEEELGIKNGPGNPETPQYCNCGRLMSGILIINPFFGALIAWILLYEVSSTTEAYIILGLEGGALALMFISVWLERGELTWCLKFVHIFPIMPFLGVCAVIWFYLEKGGVCYRNDEFWFDNCGICANATDVPSSVAAELFGDWVWNGTTTGEDGYFPYNKDVSATCPNGEDPFQGTYCGDTANDRFCYFSY